MKIFKKCIPSVCESVYRETFLPHRETMRLSSKPWDLRGLLLSGGRVVQCSDSFMHGIVLSLILYKSIRIKNKKFVGVLDKYRGGRGVCMSIALISHICVKLLRDLRY